jgi:hypothetical protein
MSFLDRTEAGENQRIRRKPSGIPLPSQELPGGRAVEDKGMKITVLGFGLIVAVVIAAILLLRNLGPGSNPPNPPTE